MNSGNKKEVEELLKILEQKTDRVLETPTIKAKPFKKRPKRTMVFRTQKVHKFIKENGYKSGKKYLEAFILYYLFTEWCRKRKNKLTPTGYKAFLDVMSIYFPRKFSRTQMIFYGLNKNLRLSILTPHKEAAIRRYHNEKKRIQKK